MLCKIWGIFLKIVCTAGVEKKTTCKCSVNGGKISFLLEIMIHPRENNGPYLITPRISMKFCMMVVPHKTNLNIYSFGTIECNITSQ